MQTFSLKYTLCYIRRGSQILLLNRLNPPLMGLWNGTGGKIEHGENPEESVIREVYEETGISLSNVTFVGIVTWDTEKERSGMYVYFADLPDGFTLETPVATNEGILDWKEIDWVLQPANMGIPPSSKHFLPVMLTDETRYVHHCVLRNGQLTAYERTPLEWSQHRFHSFLHTGR